MQYFPGQILSADLRHTHILISIIYRRCTPFALGSLSFVFPHQSFGAREFECVCDKRPSDACNGLRGISIAKPSSHFGPRSGLAYIRRAVPRDTGIVISSKGQ